MTTRAQSPGAKAYFETLRKVFESQAQVLTAVLPHFGERGRNDEERFRDFLRNTLPRKYGVGTGFVVSALGGKSKQVDVVIYDDIHNSPLHREIAAFVFPIEMVYATIEVKGRIRPQDLKSCIRNIESVRSLASHKRYSLPAATYPPGQPDKGQAVQMLKEDPTAPRAFVVAYDASGWATAESFARSWAQALRLGSAHLHGVLVISKGWLVSQHIYTPGQVRLTVHTSDALLRFHDKLRRAIHVFYMQAAHLEPYYDLEQQALPDVVTTVPVHGAIEQPNTAPKRAGKGATRPNAKAVR